MTILYSQSILKSLSRYTECAKNILQYEMQFEVKTKRFVYCNYLYPIQIVCFEHPTRLGYFDPKLYEIGIHIDLALNESAAIDVLKHELVHYITYLEYGKTDHGAEFQAMAQKFGFPKEIAKATSHYHHPTSLKAVEEKIQKLLRLAQTSNIHEAESALLKAEELMLKHDIHVHPDREETFAIKRVLKEKRTSQKQRSIAQILKHFSVETIFHHGGGSSYLELIGLKEHVEIAAYVADYLSEKLEELWLKVKKEHNLGGMSSKNSFFLGIAKGYDEQKRTHIKERALIQANLKRALAMIYPSLASSRSFSLHDATSHSLGQTAGRSLNIHPGVHQKNQKFLQHKI